MNAKQAIDYIESNRDALGLWNNEVAHERADGLVAIYNAGMNQWLVLPAADAHERAVEAIADGDQFWSIEVDDDVWVNDCDAEVSK